MATTLLIPTLIPALLVTEPMTATMEVSDAFILQDNIIYMVPLQI